MHNIATDVRLLEITEKFEVLQQQYAADMQVRQLERVLSNCRAKV